MGKKIRKKSVLRFIYKNISMFPVLLGPKEYGRMDDGALIFFTSNRQET